MANSSKALLESQMSTSEVIPRDFLCCKLCDEEYKEPKQLVCLHSFCKFCLHDHVEKTLKDGIFWCPICGTENEFTEGGVDDFSDNHLARRLSSPTVGNQDRDRLCQFCKNAGNFIESSIYCVSCDGFLCDNCTTMHQDQFETASHEIKKIEEYDQHMRNQDSAKSSGKFAIETCCPYYDPLDIGAMFCVDCDTAVCSDCHLSYHEEHRCADLVAVAENFENKIKAPLLQLENDTRALKETLNQLQSAETKTIKHHEELHEIIRRRKKCLYELINNYEAVLLAEIDKRNDHKMKEIADRRGELQMHLAAIDGVRDFTEKLLAYGSCEEKVLMRRTVSQRVRDLCAEEPMTDPIDPIKIKLTEPQVTVETICNLFGELYTEDRPQSPKEPSVVNNSGGDSGHASDTMENNETEIANLKNRDLTKENVQEDLTQSETEAPLDSNEIQEVITERKSSPREEIRNVKFHEEVQSNEYEEDTSFHLDNPKREINLPPSIQHECIKGIGINKHGDIIIGASSTSGQTIYVLEKRGILRGQIKVPNGWNIHSVASDGKVAICIARGDNRYKVRVYENDGTGHLLTDTQIDSFVINFITADGHGNLFVTSNRYPHITNSGKTSKLGGNVAMFDKDGRLIRRITNEDYQELGLHLMEKPHCISIFPKLGSFYVTDPGSHSVMGFDASGELIFEYGNSDTNGEIFDGPDHVCVDCHGNIIVTDKREGRVDILNSRGKLNRSLIADDILKFVGVTQDKLLMAVTTEGSIKFYDYLK
ncbi:hypothetical protein CHS0354_036034 [Potamilus streckersoni]|uniref:Uncharacterized protein n=1 Tax=Potamilus streckersoni TaxID=2493646 RepID=A0AAE0TFR9_9BIVA|nr:hypothetical protein CHS0354_036034 [Potamilus streckersoni]